MSLGIHGAQQDLDVDADITSLPNEGQQTMANSISVAVASDQSAVPVSLPNEGQQTMANSISVTVASDQTAVSIADGGSTISIDDGSGSITVDGPLTDAQLRATPVIISGAVITF